MPNANTITSEAATKNSIPTRFPVRACNGLYLIDTAENQWRASLVPAAAVIPALIAYINIVAVKKLVVET